MTDRDTDKYSDDYDRAVGRASHQYLVLIANLLLALVLGFSSRWLGGQTCSTVTIDPPTAAGGNQPGSESLLEHAQLCQPTFGLASQILLAVAGFVALTVLELVLVSRRVESYRRRQSATWRITDLASQRLHNINLYMGRVAEDSYGLHDRYVNHFLDELATIEERLLNAAERKELLVPSDHFLSRSDVLGAFRAGSVRRYRYSWPIEGPGPVFTTAAWRQFFSLTANMVSEGELAELRALLILQDWDLLESARIRNVLTFYSRLLGAEAKAVLAADYGLVAREHGVRDTEVDFGIYGDGLLYVTENGSPDTVGRFTKDTRRIQKYNSLFETIWTSQSIVRTLDTPGPALTFAELISRDGDAT